MNIAYIMVEDAQREWGSSKHAKWLHEFLPWAFDCNSSLEWLDIQDTNVKYSKSFLNFKFVTAEDAYVVRNIRSFSISVEYQWY